MDACILLPTLRLLWTKYKWNENIALGYWKELCHRNPGPKWLTTVSSWVEKKVMALPDFPFITVGRTTFRFLNPKTENYCIIQNNM